MILKFQDNYHGGAAIRRIIVFDFKLIISENLILKFTMHVTKLHSLFHICLLLFTVFIVSEKKIVLHTDTLRNTCILNLQIQWRVIKIAIEK